MKPTKDDYTQIIDSLNRADRTYLTGFGHLNTVTLSDEKLKVVKAALRLAANMPSEKEIKTIVFHYTGDPQYPDYSGAAVAILKRLGVEK